MPLLRNDDLKKYRTACIAYLAMVFFCMVLRLLFYYGAFDAVTNDELNDFIWSLLSQLLVMSGIPLFLVYILENKKSAPGNRFERRPLEERETAGAKGSVKRLFGEIGFKKPKASLLLLSIPIGVLFMFATIGVSYINQSILLWFGYELSFSASEYGGAGMFFVALFGTAVLPGVCEEILHRGILVRGLKGRMRDRDVIILTALLFSFMHTSVLQTVFTFLGGLALGILAVKGKSIFPAMIVHFMNNGIGTYFEYAEANGWAGGGFFEWLTGIIIDNSGVAILLWLLCIGGLIVLIYVYLKQAGALKKREPVFVYNMTNTMGNYPGGNYGNGQGWNYPGGGYGGNAGGGYGNDQGGNYGARKPVGTPDPFSEYSAPQQTASRPIFDAYTGELLRRGVPPTKSGARFDPFTGKPMPPRFDIYTGQALASSALNNDKFDDDREFASGGKSSAESASAAKADGERPEGVTEKSETANDEEAEPVKVRGKQRIWLFACVFAGALLTLFSFIWGLAVIR